MSVRMMPKPEWPSKEGWWDDADCVAAVAVPGSRLYGGADINGVRYWYHPASDQLIRADAWLDIVGDPDVPEPDSESLCD